MNLPIAFFLLACLSDKVTTPPAVEAKAEPEKKGAVFVENEGLQADIERVNAFHLTRPEYERPFDLGTRRPRGVASMSSKTCGACHQAIYEEWKVSTHAAAWHDVQFQKEIQKSGNRWLCLNCHTPLLTQHDTWPVGLVDDDVEQPQLVINKLFDKDLREEGITCAACHVQQGVIHGPGIGGKPPHPVKVDDSFRSGELCMRCHQAVATYPGKQFTCTFNTGEEWKNGPYPEEGKSCPDCHMPRTERPAAVGGEPRTIGKHFWRGSGIGKVKGVVPPVEANPPALAVSASVKGDHLVVVATNARAGHMLPTGDPERWVAVDVTFENAAGAPVGEPWSARLGQEWTWYPTPEKHGDTRLKPRESRSYEVVIPSSAVSAVIVGSSHRMSKETQEYHQLGDYPISVETLRQTVPLTKNEPSSEPER